MGGSRRAVCGRRQTQAEQGWEEAEAGEDEQGEGVRDPTERVSSYFRVGDRLQHPEVYALVTQCMERTGNWQEDASANPNVGWNLIWTWSAKVTRQSRLAQAPLSSPSPVVPLRARRRAHHLPRGLPARHRRRRPAHHHRVSPSVSPSTSPSQA